MVINTTKLVKEIKDQMEKDLIEFFGLSKINAKVICDHLEIVGYNKSISMLNDLLNEKEINDEDVPLHLR